MTSPRKDRKARTGTNRHFVVHARYTDTGYTPRTGLARYQEPRADRERPITAELRRRCPSADNVCRTSRHVFTEYKVHTPRIMYELFNGVVIDNETTE